jgi:hypothetical protein
MDKDALRKQLYDEIHAQFDARLKEARRQKSELEEEMESSEDKWRSERRRLNAEIDRLESSISEARDARRTPPAPKSRGLDPQELTKLQAAADEKFKRAEQDWGAEKAKLQAEVSRLQRGITELIERSNNPLRANQGEKDKLESKLQDAISAKHQAEDALMRAKAEWEEEKLKLVGEAVKTRRSTSTLKVSKPKEDDDRVRQLERQLDEAIRTRDNQLREAAAAREKLERDLAKLRVAAASQMDENDVARMKSALSEARAEATLATRRIEDERSAADKERTSLEKLLRQADMTKVSLERELEKVRQELESRGSQDGDSVSSEVVEQLRVQYDDRMQEMIRQKTQLSEELRNATSLLDEQRHKLGMNGTGHSQLQPMNSEAIDAEVTRIQGMIARIASIIENPETELSTVIRKNVERAELDAYLKGILFSLGRAQSL